MYVGLTDSTLCLYHVAFANTAPFDILHMRARVAILPSPQIS